MVGDQTRGRWMAGADRSTELCRLPSPILQFVKFTFRCDPDSIHQWMSLMGLIRRTCLSGQQEVLMIPIGPQEMDEDPIGESVGAVGH